MKNRQSTLTTSLVIEWGYVAGSAVESKYTGPEIEDMLLDAEDDIVVTAAFVYNTDYSFGDEATFQLIVSFDEQAKEYIVTDEWTMGKYMCRVQCKVRGARLVL